MRVLVTGGAGYVGSDVAGVLAGRGMSVVILDSLVTGHRQAAANLPLIVGELWSGAGPGTPVSG